MTINRLGALPTQTETERFLTITQTAEYLQRNPATIRQMIRNGDLAAMKINGSNRVLIALSAIHSLLTPAGGDSDES
jgi:excisionase family DNA binding protein